MISDFAKWLLDIFSSILQFLLDLPFHILGWIWAGLIYIFDLLPVADYLKQAATSLSMLPPSAWYFLNMINIKFGLTVVTGAYLIRFFIRRLPVVG